MPSLNELLLENSLLKEKIKQLESHIKILNNPARKAEELDFLLGHYDIILNPPSKDLEFGKSKFSIDLNELVCVEARGRMKILHFTEIQESKNDKNGSKDFIIFDGSFHALMDKIDKIQSHMCQVNKRLWVNVRHFSYPDIYKNKKNKKTIKCQIDFKPTWIDSGTSDIFEPIIIDDLYFQDFIKAKNLMVQHLEHYYSKLSDYKNGVVHYK
jgi:hypothetical protein